MHRLRYKLITSTAIAVLYVATASGQETPPAVVEDIFWISVEGQYLNFEGNAWFDPNIMGLDTGFQPLLLSPDHGWLGGVAIGYQATGSPYSVVGRLRYGRSNRRTDASNFASTNTFTFGYSNYVYTYTSRSERDASATYREEHYIADLEIGRDVGIGAVGIRAHAGLRFGHFTGRADGSGSRIQSYGFGSAYTFGARGRQKSRFSGIGPRLGFEATVPVNNRFLVTGGIAGALLYGNRKTQYEGVTFYSLFGTYFTSSPVGSAQSERTWVPNVEVEAALHYLIGDNGKMSVGYRYDHYWDVLDYGAGPVDRSIHGPFIRFTLDNSGWGG